MDVICLKECVCMSPYPASFQKNNARLTLLESVGSEKTYVRGKLECEPNIYTCLSL